MNEIENGTTYKVNILIYFENANTVITFYSEFSVNLDGVKVTWNSFKLPKYSIAI